MSDARLGEARPIGIRAFFLEDGPPPAVEDEPAPVIDWEGACRRIETDTAKRLADAETRHQTEVAALKARLDETETLCRQTVAAMERAFAESIGQLVAEATARILDSTAPIATETMASLVSEVLEALPEGAVATIRYPPSIDPAILPDLPGLSHEPDPKMPAGEIRAELAVGAITASLSRRIATLCKRVAEG